MAGERLEKALEVYRKRYREAARAERSTLLDEFCRMSRYHRKYAIVLLNEAVDPEEKPVRRRRLTYSAAALSITEAIWRAAGYPWSERLKAMLPLWMPWAREHLTGLTPEIERQAMRMSARQMDRRLAKKRRQLKRRLYGRTKPGTLLKHQIPVKAGPWEVTSPGYAEIDLVSHSGPSAKGDFGYTLNLTDVHLGWCESRAVLGKSEERVVEALDDIRRALPFPLRAIDSDNGSEFINYELLRYCRDHDIQFTRGRPYKKDDNARIEQKNWTHVRRIFGWERYDRPQALQAMNDLYGGDLRLMMNLFQPSVKLRERTRRGAKLTRRYEPARTPLDRLIDFYGERPKPGSLRLLVALRQRTDPFTLSETIDRALARIASLQNGPLHPSPQPAARRTVPPRGDCTSLEIAHAQR